MSPPVILRRDGAVASLVLNRPDALNAINIPMAEAFHACCIELAADASVRAVVLRATGKAFGVGGDLNALRVDPVNTARRLIELLHESVKMLAALDAPVIASLHGAVAGGSLSLAMACDLAIAAEDTRFNLAYVNIGASCDVSGSWNLPRLVGLRNAMAIALLGDTFDAREAWRLGLVNRLAPPAALDAETDALARRLASGPTLAMGRMKRLLRQAFDNDLSSQLDREQANFLACAASGDFAAGLEAFFARGKPEFQGV
ncbi:enoyl-CoA hydratase/isomerase family protein [Noviherbaspirillum aridicola]|uniref:Enoyl-CoA hydratase n=1 Tax=Noviherbaspirillum aridicola TaxID=2849687 RepID=A0ABQ4Q7V7_9BURK|nr:enoyl-CoA hydratase-related protein [Noviherbaspirillum aridicola]GIZ52789.1 enoyl-CoA hydratase [Noviherbaspirillum aridicola]